MINKIKNTNLDNINFKNIFNKPHKNIKNINNLNPKLLKNKEFSKRVNFIEGLSYLPDGCQKIILDYSQYFITAKGSTFKHQAWQGGISGSFR